MGARPGERLGEEGERLRRGRGEAGRGRGEAARSSGEVGERLGEAGEEQGRGRREKRGGWPVDAELHREEIWSCMEGGIYIRQHVFRKAGREDFKCFHHRGMMSI